MILFGNGYAAFPSRIRQSAFHSGKEFFMHYDYTAIPDRDVPQAVEPIFQHAVTTYASEVNKTVGMWRAVPDHLLDFKPHDKTNPIRTILVHQLLSERRFFAEFAGLKEPPVEELLPTGEQAPVSAYIDKYVWLAKERLPQFAQGTAAWWLEQRDFFGGLKRERIWIFWRRVLHTCHHRTQVQTWLRLAGQQVPAIYGPSGDVKWDAADPTYSLEAAKRGGK
jgi:uncharacterized damage-inducible protein DinB